MTGLSYLAVRATLDRFAEGGWAAIRPATRGRARGDGRCLSEAQEDAIRRIIIDKRPEQLKMEFFLWSRAAVGQLIEQEYGTERSGRDVAGVREHHHFRRHLDGCRRHEVLANSTDRAG